MSVESGRPSLVGSTIGNYRIVDKLGEGGMGVVYLAEHPLIGKKVALKVLHQEHSANPDVVGRFFNEAKAVNEIGHPNIVDIVDYGMVNAGSGTGFVYLIMEFLDGAALSAVIERDAPIPARRALSIAMQVADALGASHRKGIIHRDLKPDNIFLVQRGREEDIVKVLDFGIAKLTGDAPGSHRTRTGIVMGTPAYMSPEQCEGKGNIDHRTDVYALGIVLYEMLTGRVPFEGEGYGEVLVQHLTVAATPPRSVNPEVPPEVDALVMRALEKRREARFQNMDELMAALRAPGATMPPGARPVPEPEDDVELAPPRRKGFFVLGLAIALLGAGIGLWQWMGGRGGSIDHPTPPAAVPSAAGSRPETPPAAPTAHAEPAGAKGAPATVVLRVNSEPPGADIVIAGGVKGKTPAQIDLPRGDGTVDLVLRLEGYQEKTKQVRLDRDAEIEMSLTRVRNRRPPRPSSPGRPSGDDVLAPSF